MRKPLHPTPHSTFLYIINDALALSTFRVSKDVSFQVKIPSCSPLLSFLISSPLASPFPSIPLLPILPTTSNAPLILSPNLTGPALRAKCFTQQVPPKPLWLSTNLRDCRSAIEQIIQSVKSPDTAITIGRSEQALLTTPKTWRSGTCAVLVDVGGGEGKNGKVWYDIMTYRELLDSS